MPWGPRGQPPQRGTSLGWGEFIDRLCSIREGWPHWECGLVCIRRASHAAACSPSNSPVCIPCHTVGTCLCPLPVPAHLLKLSSSVTSARIPSLLPGVRTGSCVSYAIGNAASPALLCLIGSASWCSHPCCPSVRYTIGLFSHLLRCSGAWGTIGLFLPCWRVLFPRVQPSLPGHNSELPLGPAL